MSTPAPRYWKTLKRHPLSAEYRDLSPRERATMLDGVKEHGVIDGRKVTIHDGMVLDGWQIYQACVEAEVKPPFGKIPKGMTPERYVEIKNEARRHETLAEMEKHAEQRRARVIAGRRDGKSTRQMAEEEGVSEKTIRNDLAKPGADGSAPEPPDGKVKGRDGKEYPTGTPTRGRSCAPGASGSARRRPPGVRSVPRPGRRTRPGPTRRARPGAAQRNGQPLYDDLAYRGAKGAVAREIDKLAGLYGMARTKEHEALHDALKAFHQRFVDFWRLCREQKKPAAVPA
jgi:hypothetical protein